MGATTIEVQDLPTRWPEILPQVTAGTEIILTEGHVPRARLVALPAGQTRVAGLHPGAMQASADFDAPLPDDFWMGRP